MLREFKLKIKPAILILILLGICTIMGKKIKNNKIKRCYELEQVKQLRKGPLSGKQLCFLGSSVTLGSAAGGISFADYIGRRNGCYIIKEAVSGTTLVNRDENSYVARIQRLQKDMKFDLLICQLSTNDATSNQPLGVISISDEYDTTTITGAIEFIIDYTKKTFQCPIVFYTGTKFECEAYNQMVKQLHVLQGKWEFGIIDLWNNKHMKINNKLYSIYMEDPIHPTNAGYLKWWTPEIERYLNKYIAKHRI